jgi:hypothetical protein
MTAKGNIIAWYILIQMAQTVLSKRVVKCWLYEQTSTKRNRHICFCLINSNNQMS